MSPFSVLLLSLLFVFFESCTEATGHLEGKPTPMWPNNSTERDTCIGGQVESSSSSSSLSSTQSGFSSESCEQITDWSRFSFTFSHSYLFVNCSNIKLCIKLNKLILKLIEFKFIVIFFHAENKYVTGNIS